MAKAVYKTLKQIAIETTVGVSAWMAAGSHDHEAVP